MPLRKFRYFPDDDDDGRAVPRLAVDRDVPVVSAVHGMHTNLWAFAENSPEPPLAPYPGWVRLTLPLVVSGGLWLAIFWSLGYLR